MKHNNVLQCSEVQYSEGLYSEVQHSCGQDLSGIDAISQVSITHKDPEHRMAGNYNGCQVEAADSSHNLLPTSLKIQ